MSESEPTNETSRMAQSDEIVKQLEKSVPRWEGFGPGGWTIAIQLVRCSHPCPPGRQADEDVQADALLIVEQIRDYKDARYAPMFCSPKSRDSNTPLQRNAAQRHSGRGPGYGFETQLSTSRTCPCCLADDGYLR